jgi:ankyrin repeat protein
MSDITKLHDAVKCADLGHIKVLLDENRRLANSVSEIEARGTYPLHVAAEFGQTAAARVLLEYGAGVSLLDADL